MLDRIGGPVACDVAANLKQNAESVLSKDDRCAFGDRDR